MSDNTYRTSRKSSLELLEPSSINEVRLLWVTSKGLPPGAVVTLNH